MKEKTGKQIAEELCNTLNSFNNRETRKEFVEEICNQHRSLQQQTIGLLMEVVKAFAEMRENNRWDLRNGASTKLCKEINDAFGDKFRMPFI